MPYLVRLAATILPVALSLVSLPARADLSSTFDFSGICADCTGIGTGELTLNNYTIGAEISPSNFVSFTYNGSNLLAAYTITASDDFFIGGSIGEPLPGPETFSLFGPDESFTSLSTGFWCTGASCVADYGAVHVWSAASTDVPEPMTIALLGGSLLGIAVVRRMAPAQF